MGTLFIENRSRIERYYARSVLVRFGPVVIKKSALYLNVFSRIERNSTCGGLSPFRARDNIWSSGHGSDTPTAEGSVDF